MSIKLEQGITKGFVTRTGFKQGDNLSPLLYNLFANRLPSVFDDECDGVMVNNMTVNCLSWADDCVLISQSSTGLQRLIDKTLTFFNQLGLSCNVKENQCMIFNKRGHKANSFLGMIFFAKGKKISIVNNLTHLGLVFVPSGASTTALN